MDVCFFPLIFQELRMVKYRVLRTLKVNMP